MGNHLALASIVLGFTLIAGCPGPDMTVEGGVGPDAGGDGSVRDAGLDAARDSGARDASLPDVGQPDVGLGDASASGDGGDSGASSGDAGDAGSIEAGTSEAGTSEAGTSEAGTEDAGTGDASLEAGTGDAAIARDASTDASDGAVITIDAHLDDAATISDAALIELPVNGCTRATATDLTATGAASIAFTSFTYTPACVRVRVGTTVTFNGMFSFHPLQAGQVVGAITTPATPGTTPLPTTALNTGTTATFTLTSSGTFPYYCQFHAVAFNMMGAIYVE